MALPAPATPRASTARGNGNGNGGEQEEHDWEEFDGRSTPVPGSTSSSSRTNTSSPPITLPPQSPVKPSTPAPSGATMTVLRPGVAQVGFGSAPSEDALRHALSSKDRIFVVMLSKEMEAFIARIVAGEKPAESPGQGHFSILGANVRMQSQPTSKFQRMLVYRVAEWYGIKAVSGPDLAIYIGVMGHLDPKSATLRLASLVPEREKSQPTFQIMQRRPQPGAPTETAGEGGPTSRKTLEQREAEYALARERIFQQEPKKTFEPVYASLHHPPKPDRQQEFEMGSNYYDAVQYGYPQMYPNYYPQGYDSMMYTWQPPTGQATGMMPQWGYSMQGRSMQGGAGLVQQQQQQQQHQQQQQQPMQPQQGVGQSISMPTHAIPSIPTIPQIPPPPNMPTMQQTGAFAPLQHQPYTYGYTGPSLQHPQPQRPPMQPHSSASSSISSRSYQDYSRPHSRGSNTSTRSATSSVRLGPMYPAQSYRQKGMKLTNMQRGHSPSSTTTASSRSSKSITVSQPSNHPLPQRPDWSRPSASGDFPPLKSDGAKGAAQDNSKAGWTGVSNGSNGIVANGINGVNGLNGVNGVNANGAVHSTTKAINGTSTNGSSGQVTNGTSHPEVAVAPTTDDPDFPRRTPIRAQLYDPATKGISRPPSTAPTIHAQATGVPPASAGLTGIVVTPGMTPEDVIEAKLQALSVTAGVSIGPPPVRAGPAAGASYAKAVRRE